MGLGLGEEGSVTFQKGKRVAGSPQVSPADSTSGKWAVLVEDQGTESRSLKLWISSVDLSITYLELHSRATVGVITV